MVIPETNPVIILGDTLLTPFMWILGGFKTPVQRTHGWHVVNLSPSLLDSSKGVKIIGYDKKAKFFHNSLPGLFHMPIFGGLTKYVAIEVKGYRDHWHIIWRGEKCQIHRLKITKPGLKLLIDKGGYSIYAVDDSGKFLNIKIKGTGIIGDSKYRGLELL